mmetsp:Transcript_32018/g.53997  ORF Transcript_32018/g.53997 Transcript_32018/m.53997 type:complete len:586 (+) Transcript_32018:81-1838(+)
MQRLVDKIVNEFQQNCDYIEVNALDGNGDSFQVFQGGITKLNSFHFANILRHPGCFYFFSVTSIPVVQSPELEDAVMQRDICWLTDPAPPITSARSHNSISVSWPFVSLCGITPPSAIDSVQYILEIAEGVEYKRGYFTKFISDVCAVDYTTVCGGPNIDSTTVNGLRPARWYHLRLSVEYLGQRFMSDTHSIHTEKWSPTAPSIPRIQILPVRSSFDLTNDRPVRLDMLISWYAASHNGAKILSYQLQVQRFDKDGNVIQSVEAVMRKEKKTAARIGTQRFEKPDRDRKSNQWTQSPGRNALQIHNSLVHGDRSPSRSRSRRLASESSELPLLGVSDPTVVHSGADDDFGGTQERRYKWEIIFDNILTSVKCSSPGPDQAEWHLRVRARNSEGWSDFGPILKINSMTHPSLFQWPPPNNAKGTDYYDELGAQSYLQGNEAEIYKQDMLQQRQQQQVQHQQLQQQQAQGINTPPRMHGSLPQSSDINTRTGSQQQGSSSMKGKFTSSNSFVDNIDMNIVHLVEEKGAYQSPIAGGAAKAKSPKSPKLHVLHFKQGNQWEAPRNTNPDTSGVNAPISYSSSILPKV